MCAELCTVYCRNTPNLFVSLVNPQMTAELHLKAPNNYRTRGHQTPHSIFLHGLTYFVGCKCDPSSCHKGSPSDAEN